MLVYNTQEAKTVNHKVRINLGQMLFRKHYCSSITSRIYVWIRNLILFDRIQCVDTSCK